VADVPNVESNGCFKALVLDCVVSGAVVESGGGGPHNGKRWLLRRGAMTWCVAATYPFDSLLRKYVSGLNARFARYISSNISFLSFFSKTTRF
jgi:hypothetical protein